MTESIFQWVMLSKFTLNKIHIYLLNDSFLNYNKIFIVEKSLEVA